MTVHYQGARAVVLHADCLDVLRELDDNGIDSIVTDPPYGLGFMGKQWDDLPPGEEWARECLRVLKPGGYLLAFGGSRTWHRLAVAVEDAGFGIRDSIAWLYGSGFPKSRNVSKAIDKAAGAAGAAQQWRGWGTTLKPAFEPIVVARKPLAGTVAANVLEHGTGALNIDACRIATDEPLAAHHGTNGAAGVTYGQRREYVPGSASPKNTHTKGRWPTNVALDESQAAELDQQTGVSQSRIGKPRAADAGTGWGMTATGAEYDDQGGASRFFPVFKYQAKAPAKERPKDADGKGHSTVKPLELMRWLVRLVTPPGGTVLDTFAGSGTTVEAAILEGFKCFAIEKEAEYLPLIQVRIDRCSD